MLSPFSLIITHFAGLPLLHKYAPGVLGCPQAHARPIWMCDEGVATYMQELHSDMQEAGSRAGSPRSGAGPAPCPSVECNNFRIYNYNFSQNPPRFRPAPLCCPEMSRHIGLHGNEMEWRVNAWMGMIWITLVWMQTPMTPIAPFCMAACLHDRPGLGPESGTGRRKHGMTRTTKILWTSQGFWSTNLHVHQRSVGRVMEAQTQAEYDPHGWAYLHADNTKCHACV